MKLDLRNSCIGNGDALACLWIWEGARNAGLDPTLYTHKPAVCVPFLPPDRPPVETMYAPDSAATLLGLQNEWRESVEVPRLALMARRANEVARAQGWTGPDILPVQPRLRLPVQCPEVPEWAEEGRPLDVSRAVLLFPFSEWTQREWPLAHWQRLSLELAEEGIPVVAVGAAKDRERLATVAKRYAFGWPWAAVIGLVSRARAVVSNDSGPLHLAAALGRPAVAVHAMMRAESLTGLYPLARSVCPHAEAVPCAGCHALAERGYRAPVCNAACPALATVSPWEVRTALGDLGGV